MSDTTTDITGVTVEVRAKARKADHWCYGWNGWLFFADYRTGALFAVAK